MLPHRAAATVVLLTSSTSRPRTVLEQRDCTGEQPRADQDRIAARAEFNGQSVHVPRGSIRAICLRDAPHPAPVGGDT